MATVVLWAMAWPLVSLGFLNRYDSLAASWIEDVYQRKDRAALTLSDHRPRLIVVGGSGALFSVDGQLMSRRLGVPVLNYATHAGLGQYLLYRARQVTRPGDSILLCPETELWRGIPGELGEIEWEYVSTRDKPFVFAGGYKQALRLLYLEPAENYWHSLVGWGYRLTGRNSCRRTGYPVWLLDSAGDLRVAPKRSNFTLPRDYPAPEPDSPALSPFDSFAKWARDNGVRVFYSFPACAQPSSPSAGHGDVPQRLRSLLDGWGWIVLDSPREASFPQEWFYDTVYHCDGSCRRIHTDRLVRRLSSYYPTSRPQASTSAGIFLMCGGIEPCTQENSFTNHPGVTAKYLVPSHLGDPDAVTAQDVAALADAGVPIWFDDPAVLDHLPSTQWRAIEEISHVESLGGWLAEHGNDFMLLASAGRQSGQADAVDGILPSPVASAVDSSDAAVAILSGGSGARVDHLLSGHKVSLTLRLRSLVGSDAPDLKLDLIARSDQSTHYARLSANGTLVCSAPQGEIAMVAIDPMLGIVTSSTTFRGASPKTVSSLWRVVRR